MITQEDQERIEKYVKGELSTDQIDELWIKFIQDPELYDYFNTYLHLIALAKNPAIQLH